MTEADGIHLWLLLARAARAVEAHAVRSIEALGMCGSDFGVLEALLHKGPLAVHELGEKVLLSSGSITTAVDRLERRGLVERRSAARDRRARIVWLTEEGSAVAQRVFEEHRQDMERATAGLSAAERAELAGLLRKLGHSAERG
jgi:MarR family 2-MHQ and catechol resistance regulon transcriptional repressor